MVSEGSGWSVRRRRSLLIACFLGGAALVVLGLWRWPPQHTGRGRNDFIVDSRRYDVALGVADYLSATVVLFLGPVLWRRRAPKECHFSSMSRGEAGAWTLVAFCGSIVLGIWAGLCSIGMLLALAQAT